MASNITASAEEYLAELGGVIKLVGAGAINCLVERLAEAWQRDQQVLVFGNGGSAYTSSHFITDLVKTATVEGVRRIRAISLVDNYGLTTAIGNDIDYQDSFVYPLATYGKPGDLAIAISGSGNSENVVRACQWAKEHGLTLVCLTGFSGGKIAGLADIHVNIPSDNYGLIEDLHLSIGHIITQALKSRVLAGSLAERV